MEDLTNILNISVVSVIADHSERFVSLECVHRGLGPFIELADHATSRLADITAPSTLLD